MSAKYVCVDLEMTGGAVDWNEVIQIGAVLLDEKFNEIDTFLSNVYPENEEAFSSASEKIHNLSLEDLEDAPMIYEVLENFEKWLCQKCNFFNPNELRKLQICGQSVINDINFLKNAYENENMTWNFPYTFIDLQNISFFVFETLKNNQIEVPRRRNLDAIASFFKLEREGEFHNALEDAQLTALCLKEMMSYSQKLTL